MNLNELIERLEEYREQLGGEVEVRLMTQPNYPFENSVKGVCSTEEMDVEDEFVSIVYIVESNQIGYGTKLAWDVAF